MHWTIENFWIQPPRLYLLSRPPTQQKSKPHVRKQQKLLIIRSLIILQNSSHTHVKVQSYSKTS